MSLRSLTSCCSTFLAAPTWPWATGWLAAGMEKLAETSLVQLIFSVLPALSLLPAGAFSNFMRLSCPDFENSIKPSTWPIPRVLHPKHWKFQADGALPPRRQSAPSKKRGSPWLTTLSHWRVIVVCSSN